MRYNFRVDSDAGSLMLVDLPDVDHDAGCGLGGFLDGCATQFVEVLACGDEVGGCLVYVRDFAAGAHGESRFTFGDAGDLLNVLQFGFDTEGAVDEVDAQERSELWAADDASEDRYRQSSNLSAFRQWDVVI